MLQHLEIYSRHWYRLGTGTFVVVEGTYAGAGVVGAMVVSRVHLVAGGVVVGVALAAIDCVHSWTSVAVVDDGRAGGGGVVVVVVGARGV